MLDFEATPIFQYDGPPERRKALESLGRVYLGMVKGAMGGDLPFAKHAMKLPDGTVISATSIRNSGVVDIIRVVVPQEARRVKKGVHLETVEEEFSLPVPLIVLNYDSAKPLVQVFMNCKAAMERFKYPDTGTDDQSTYKTYGINYSRQDTPSVTEAIDIRSLKPIKHGDCYFDDDINTGIVYLYDDGTVVRQMTEIPLYSYVLSSAIVKNQKGYSDYGTWALIFAQNDLPLLERFSPTTFNIKMAFCDPKKGYREYPLETVSLDYNVSEPTIHSVSAVSIFDYFGTPYFVSSYVGVKAYGVA